MAYGKIYTTTVNSLRGKTYTLDIYKDGYAGAVKTLRLSGITFQYVNTENLILTSSLDVQIVNTFTDTEFDDMLSNTEREYKCELIDADSSALNVLFAGYLLVDILEKELVPYGTVSLTFSDHLKRLQDEQVVVTTGAVINLVTVIDNALLAIGWSYDIVINSRLFNADHDDTSTDNFLIQTYLDYTFFQKDNITNISYWEALIEICKTFSLCLYIYGEELHIERYNDIEDNTTRSICSHDAPYLSLGTTTLQEYNKQTDFNYVDRSQSLSFVSGLSDLVVNLDYKEPISMIPDIIAIPDAFENATDEDFWDCTKDANRTINAWARSDVLGAPIVLFENQYRMQKGIYLSLEDTFETVKKYSPLIYKRKYSIKKVSNLIKVELSLAWKMYVPVSYGENDEFLVRIAIRKGNTAPYANYFIKYDNNTGEYSLNEYNYGPNNLSQTLIGIPVTPVNGLIEFSLGIDLTPFKFDLEDEETFVIAIYPLHHAPLAVPYYRDMVIGDFETKITTTPDDNEYDYAVNAGFINKEEVDLQLFDANSFNYVNAFYASDKELLSAEWTAGGIETDTLINWYARAKIGYNMETRNKLSAKILFHDPTWIKPLSLITDTTIADKTLVVMEYALDLHNDIYSIVADEYANEAKSVIIL